MTSTQMVKCLGLRGGLEALAFEIQSRKGFKNLKSNSKKGSTLNDDSENCVIT